MRYFHVSVCLILVASFALASCSARPTAVASTAGGAALTPKAASRPTTAATPGSSPMPAKNRHPSALAPEGWVQHRLDVAGVQIALPPDWNPFRLGEASNFARPDWV